MSPLFYAVGGSGKVKIGAYMRDETFAGAKVQQKNDICKREDDFSMKNVEYNST